MNRCSRAAYDRRMSAAPHPPLYLHEEILLLALKDEKGTVEGGVMLEQALGGAILAELLLAGCVETVGPGQSPKIAAVGRAPVGDPILDDALERVRRRKKPIAASSLVSRFGETKDLRHRVARQLVRRGVLRADEDKVLWIFKRRIYPERDAAFERAILERVADAIFGQHEEVDARTTVLVGLAHATGLLGVHFDRKELKGQKRRIQKIAQGELVGRATQEAVEAAQAAIMVAAIMPAVTAAVIASSTSS